MPMYRARQIYLGRVVAEQEFEAPDDKTAELESINIDPLTLAHENRSVYWIEVRKVDD